MHTTNATALMNGTGRLVQAAGVAGRREKADGKPSMPVYFPSHHP